MQLARKPELHDVEADSAWPSASTWLASSTHLPGNGGGSGDRPGQTTADVGRGPPSQWERVPQIGVRWLECETRGNDGARQAKS